MTQAAKLKTVIRARAVKTGESYTTARRHVLATRPRAATKAKEPEPPPLPNGPEVRDPRVPRGELSNRTAIKSTGRDLAHWFKVLDDFGKREGHTRVAEHLYSEHKVPAWHAQMIAITWERARGLRQENQSCTGTFQVSVSRALAAPVDWIVDFINQPKTRKVWLKGADPSLRKSIEEAFVAGKAMEMKKAGYARMRYKWLSSVVELRAYEKPGGRSSLVADTSELPDANAVAVRRESFGKALDRLRDLAAAAAAD
ncbi:MAG: hypothetical protein KBH14_04020 [Vicinamibacteria bacterium]|nr:hypothetical protein [Vicinamibacteria bacterium]MBP9945540.1 hypothetical protein [Vicinamibacteria bacterium]